MRYYTSIYEDEITHQIMLKIYELFGNCIAESRTIPCHGKGKIKKQIKAYINAAQYGNYFVITDLDNDFNCAPLLIKKWLSGSSTNQLIFRIAVHEIESWLLADKAGFAAFFSISENLIPPEPDNIIDPKQTVIALARRSKKREIRETIVPIDDYMVNGPEYNAKFQYFVQNCWNINSARKNSPSLDKAIKAFEKIIYQ